MLALAVLATITSVTLEVLAFLWIPIFISVAFSSPRVTVLLSVWGGALALAVGGVEGYYTEPTYWLRQATMALLACFAIYLSGVMAKQRERLGELSLSDPLTGLANRRLALERLDRLLLQRDRRGGIMVLFIDLDHFKSINTQLGHTGGDEVLKEVARRLVRATRAEDTVARFGGDEFVAICPGLADEHGAEALCSRVIETINEPFLLPMTVGASIGAVIVPAGQTASPTSALREADELLMKVKDSTRNSYRIQHYT